MLVSWDDYSQDMEKKMIQTTKQFIKMFDHLPIHQAFTHEVFPTPGSTIHEPIIRRLELSMARHPLLRCFLVPPKLLWPTWHGR